MGIRPETHGERERRVVDRWLSSGLGAGACGIYLNRIRLFRAHCQSLGLDEDAELTREGLARFFDAYIGPRTGGPMATSSRNSARCAVRAWAYALRALGVDVDWAAGTIRVRRPKTGVAMELPLLSPVGRALATYLRSGRPPHISAREIFVQRGMPHRLIDEFRGPPRTFFGGSTPGGEV